MNQYQRNNYQNQIIENGHIVYKTFDKGSNVTEIDPDYPHGYGYTDVDQVDVYTEPEIDGKVYQTKYLYDLDGAVTSVTRPDLSEITYDYEETTRRLKQVNTPDGAVVYDYSSDTGLLTSVTFGSESVSYVYDGSLTTSETVSGEIEGTVSWTYNQELLVDSITVKDQSVAYGFNDDGGLTSAGDVSLAYNETTGQLTGITQGDFKEDYTFTLYGELESYTITQVDSVIYKEELIYDEVGRIKTNTITRGGNSYVEGYQYDLRGRLEKVLKDGVEQVGYTFDNNSNRLTETRGGNTIDGVYDKQDRLKTYGDLTFSYTDNGDVKRKVHLGGTDTYHYDAFGSMKQVDLADGRVLTYKMDARDRRVAKLVDGVVVQRMIYKDQLNPVAILDGENNVETLFVYGSKSNVPNYMIKNGEKYKYITDHKGSVLQVIKMSDGSVAQEISYDFWGNVLSDSTPGFQPFYYVGGLYDPDTKLIKFGVRSYDPEVGRWMQKEPLGFAGALNFYVYCEGEPVNWVDVNGLAPKYDLFIRNLYFSMSAPSALKSIGNRIIRKGVKSTVLSRFVKHYFEGNGETINLHDWNLGEQFENNPSVRKSVNEFLDLIRNSVTDNICFEFSSSDITDVTLDGELFNVGKSSFFRNARCENGICTVTFKIRDWFRDPLDLRKVFGKYIEMPGGTPYRINYEFSYTFSY